MKIFAAGWPKEIGGANTEFWHTLKLWRSSGIDVTVIPTWRDRVNEWAERIEGLGCQIALTDPDNLHGVDGLPHSVVVAFCNVAFLDNAHLFQGLGCKIVWVNCMNFRFPEEVRHLNRHDLFDRYVFQSEYQRAQLVPHLRKYGYEDDRGVVIRGAFDPDEFPLRVLFHRRGERFIIGRLSRHGVDKFPDDLWAQVARVNYPTSMRVMGWSADVEEKCGPPPAGCETLSEVAKSPQSFLGSLHALVPGCGCTAENWPRVGLEAMSAGVPIIAEDKGGWSEMLVGGGGILVQDRAEQAYQIERLAYDEQHRMGVIHQAHWNLTNELANSERITEEWLNLFHNLQGTIGQRFVGKLGASPLA